MLQQQVVQHDREVAGQFIGAGTLAACPAGQSLVEQHGADDHVYFILAGSVDVVANGRIIARRDHGQLVGEMAVVDPSARRSATLRACEETIALRVSAGDFARTADAHPAVWRALVRQLSSRLRELNRFHREPNSRPVLFLGSSVEALPVAKLIQLGLKHEPVVVKIWSAGVFGPSGMAVDELLEQAGNADFAAFVFGPDDKVASRGGESYAPRDNVIFELGLFLSRLGRERTFMIKEHAAKLKIPSDLLGIAPLTYKAGDTAQAQVALGPVCTELSERIQRLGTL
jgi:predicted nucleotide-binding protein